MKCFYSYLFCFVFVLVSVIHAQALTGGRNAAAVAPAADTSVSFEKVLALTREDVEVAAIDTDTIPSSARGVSSITASSETGVSLPTPSKEAARNTKETSTPALRKTVLRHQPADENTVSTTVSYYSSPNTTQKTPLQALTTSGRHDKPNDTANIRIHGGLKYPVSPSPNHPAPNIHKTDFSATPNELGYHLRHDGKLHHGNLWPGSLDRQAEIVHVNLNAMMPMATPGKSHPPEHPDVVYESNPTSFDCPYGKVLSPSGECVIHRCPPEQAMNKKGEGEVVAGWEDEAALGVVWVLGAACGGVGWEEGGEAGMVEEVLEEVGEVERETG
ncbi:hypothetical protein BZA77DRAFT_342107 [Pyronema omphalodes]|nr:hypothetical protein BZA77DRAFT_342107 [Pyronema omphalodes]